MKLITSQKEIKEYIEDLRFDILLYRLEQDRMDQFENIYLNPIPKNTEIEFSESLSDKVDSDRQHEYYYGRLPRKGFPKNIDKSTFDEVVIEIKEQTLLKLLNKYSDGVSINSMGWMCPLGEEIYFTENNNKFHKLFGKEFI
jgi:hypothetical protein